MPVKWRLTFAEAIPRFGAVGRMVGQAKEIGLFLLDYLTAKRDNRGMGAKKNPNAVALGKLGGKARASTLSPAERSAIARKGAAARNATLSAADRVRIALVAVQARERKRKLREKEN